MPLTAGLPSPRQGQADWILHLAHTWCIRSPTSHRAVELVQKEDIEVTSYDNNVQWTTFILHTYKTLYASLQQNIYCKALSLYRYKWLHTSTSHCKITSKHEIVLSKMLWLNMRMLIRHSLTIDFVSLSLPHLFLYPSFLPHHLSSPWQNTDTGWVQERNPQVSELGLWYTSTTWIHSQECFQLFITSLPLPPAPPPPPLPSPSFTSPDRKERQIRG